MNRGAEIIGRISNLSPREFENLVFDCMRAIGLRNIVWRTPGADGGRDIEGSVYVRDISGYEEIQTWYIECKQYSKSINWSVIWEKLSTADVSDIDVLFVVTNNNPSPHCESHITNWNRRKKKPTVRLWRGYDFPKFLRLNPSISASFGLVDDCFTRSKEFVELSKIIMNISQSAYSAQIFEQDSLHALETMAALSELFHHRLGDLDKYGRFVFGPKARNAPQYPWLHAEGNTE